MMRVATLASLAIFASPAIAQDHSGHAMPAPAAAPAADPDASCEAEAARHRAMGHPVPAGQCAPASQDPRANQAASGNQQSTGQVGMDHAAMGHDTMDHGAMNHGGHHAIVPPQGGPPPQAIPTAEPASACESEAAWNRAMGHPVPAGQCAPTHQNGSADPGATGQHQAAGQSGMAHAAMGHGTMDHASMDHGTTGHVGAQLSSSIPEAGPPPAAGSGPPRAADAIWGAAAMRESRDDLRQNQGAQNFGVLRADRFEYRAREGADGYVWDIDAWYGGDLDKLWVKSEGEGAFGEAIEQAEVQALYSRAIGPWFDLQAGVRQDLTGPTRTHAVLGIQGLARYMFELDAAAFLSDAGDLTARIEAEVDQRITQRLILQPRLEANLAAQDIAEVGIGAGIDSIEAGLRLRYEFVREFAPYLGVEQELKLGGSADLTRAAGEDPSITNYVIGVRFWF